MFIFLAPLTYSFIITYETRVAGSKEFHRHVIRLHKSTLLFQAGFCVIVVNHRHLNKRKLRGPGVDAACVGVRAGTPRALAMYRVVLE